MSEKTQSKSKTNKEKLVGYNIKVPRTVKERLLKIKDIDVIRNALEQVALSQETELEQLIKEHDEYQAKIAEKEKEITMIRQRAAIDIFGDAIGVLDKKQKDQIFPILQSVNSNDKKYKGNVLLLALKYRNALRSIEALKTIRGNIEAMLEELSKREKL